MIQNLVYNLCESFTENIGGVAGIGKTRPPLSEILAPATFEITLSPGEGYYWTTFYTSMANYQAPEGVTVYKEHLEGRSITHSAVDDRIINKGQGVVIKSSTNRVTLTKTYSRSSDNYSDNSLIGTDYEITNPGRAYALGYKDSAGVAFYKLKSTGKIKANKAYLIIEVIYLTQWKMMGNSVVHTDEYLTQWKVEGNSVVDNNAILSCGDLGQDGKYHIKISNGVTIYDIPLDEPLRKVNNVADSIEFANGIAVVTRAYKKLDWVSCSINKSTTSSGYKYFAIGVKDIYYPTMNILSSLYDVYSINVSVVNFNGLGVGCGGNLSNPILRIVNSEMEDYTAEEFRAANADVEIIYELATPTTETIQISPFPISPTDTYTSVNDTPYSAFEYKKNVEIWSCGEYSEVDGKYHILVQPQGGSIVDIALDEPLRKVNSVADKIEFASGVGTLTRKIAVTKIRDLSWKRGGAVATTSRGFYSDTISSKASGFVLLCAGYNTANKDFSWELPDLTIGSSTSSPQRVYIKDLQYTIVNDFLQGQGDNIIFHELATPTTEVIQVPQIEEADSYSMVISQGGKAVEWSSFETESRY